VKELPRQHGNRSILGVPSAALQDKLFDTPSLPALQEVKAAQDNSAKIFRFLNL
jgi:hypothetical protein